MIDLLIYLVGWLQQLGVRTCSHAAHAMRTRRAAGVMITVVLVLDLVLTEVGTAHTTACLLSMDLIFAPSTDGTSRRVRVSTNWTSVFCGLKAQNLPCPTLDVASY